MPDINITVTDKRPVCTTGTTVVCDNSDYIVHWDLDEEWSAYDSKTMRVIYMDSTYTDTVFTGDSVALPPVTVPGVVQIGLYAGDIHTSRMALLRALSSVRSASGAPANPTPDVYDQLMERMAQMEAPDWNQNDPTAKDYVKNRTHWVEVGKNALGADYQSWSTATKGGSTPIPIVDVAGTQYRNVSGRTSNWYIYYTVEDYTITVDNMQTRVTISPSADFMFYEDATVYHQIQKEFVPSEFFIIRVTNTGLTWKFDRTYDEILEALVNEQVPVIIHGGLRYNLAYRGNYMLFTNLEGNAIIIKPDSTGYERFPYLITQGLNISTGELAGAPQFELISGPVTDMQVATKKYVDKYALPAVTTSDNGKILKVVDGAWAVVDA